MTKLGIAAAFAAALFSQQAPGGVDHPRSPDDRTAQEATPRHPRHDPWGGLFVVKPAGPAGQPQAKITELPVRAVEQTPSPRLLTAERGPCNMPIIRANPEIDPKMVIPHRPQGVDTKIRVMEPAVCGKRVAEEIVR